MVNLPNVTLICIDCYNYGSAISAIKKSLQQINPFKAIFLTDIEIKSEGIETVLIPKIKSKREYSEFVIKELHKYFETDFVLIIQHDGYVLNGNSWDDNFLRYDYIGASWLYDNERTVGNGGFSVRSKMLQKVLADDDNISVLHPEDQSICIIYKFYLEENYGIKFAPEDLADHFSFELRTPIYNTFGFHGYFHDPYKPVVVISRKAAMGDIIQVEPVLEYFFNKGYRVVLDTLPQFKILFRLHYFKVDFIDEIDQRLLPNATIYNLDMSYESKPKQLHLKTYYEFCAVPESEMVLRNPKLSLGFELSEPLKMFKKYVILHIDKREQPHRNIENIDWYKVVELIKSMGYDIFILGKGEHMQITGAIEMNTLNENILCYVVAGASLFIGIDSGISNIASAFNIPSIIFFGSVNPDYIHADMSNKIAITRHKDKVCNTPYCWHDEVTCIGKECVVDKEYPPCVQFKTIDVIQAVNKFICT